MHLFTLSSPSVLLTEVICTLILQLVGGSVFENIEIQPYAGNLYLQIKDPLGNSPPLSLLYLVKRLNNQKQKYEKCVSNAEQGNHHCFQYANNTYITINKLNENCQSLNYSTTANDKLTLEINTAKIHLYGGAEHVQSVWPVEKQTYDHNSYITKVSFYQAVLEPYWLTSTGFYIYVDNAVPLFISSDPTKRTFSLIAEKRSPYVKRNPVTSLNLTLCKFENARTAHQHAIGHFLGKPSSLPDVGRVKTPIWSTWVKYKENVNEEVVLSYAQQIADHGYAGQLEIDDHWEMCYGMLQPDLLKFPNLKNLVERVKELNFTVNLWIHPFVNVDCVVAHDVGSRFDYFVRNEKNSTLMKWWRGNASYVDFTNARARQWFHKRLTSLRLAYNIDSFKFDGGESDFSPKLAMFHTMDEDHPETVMKGYVKMIASVGTNVHTRVARGTQRYPIFVTMMDRDSHWDGHLGLPTVVTQLLQMNILGYSFVLPDMIGGNFYGVQATQELYIRWVQVNVFMPSMQFSVPPWDYSEECVRLTRKFVDLHVKYAPLIIELMQKNVETGAPVNPPIWWISPNDPIALACDNEFLLGEEILVAPVITKGATTRDVYLPEGLWKDENDPERVIKGPTWLYNYEANISVLPYFTKLKSTDVEFLMYLEVEETSATWTVAFIFAFVVLTGYSLFLIFTKFLRIRKRILVWYRAG